MGNNFESKHPRSADGKFTEKLRKESGLELSVEKPFTPPDTPEGCERGQIFVGKEKNRGPGFPDGVMTEYRVPIHDEVLDGDWHLVDKLEYDSGNSQITYLTSRGYVQEFYDEDGNLEEQDFYDRDLNLIQDKKQWTEKQWYENGKLAKRAKNLIPESEEGLEFLKEDIEDSGGKLSVAEYFNRKGQQTGENYYEVSDGEIFDVNENYSPDGQSGGKMSRSFDGTECAPENELCYYRVSDGALQVAHYKVKLGNGGCFHRTDGPAIIDRRAPVGKQERYFLEGVEYTKAEWAKKTGND